ncbi:MAG: hypothetical protein ACRELV_10065 [Longimicrobiales bacterium]
MDDARRPLIDGLRARLHNPLQVVLAEARFLAAEDAAAAPDDVRDSARAILVAARRIERVVETITGLAGGPTADGASHEAAVRALTDRVRRLETENRRLRATGAVPERTERP